MTDARDQRGSWTLGVDLGGTACRLVALTRQGAVLARHVTRTPTRLTRDTALEFLLNQAAALGQQGTPFAAGIGASGPIDACGVIRNPDTLAGFSNLPLADDLRAALRAPVLVDNDAVTAAVAEHRVGNAAGASTLLHVTLGTGIGVAVLIDGRPFRGGDGVHPEAGHLTIAGPTPHCYCGRDACWEQGASRTALQRAAATATDRPERDPEAITTAQRNARRGDLVALAVFDDFGRRLADGLATLLGVFRPDVVVLGGSGALAEPQFRTSLTAALGQITVGADTYRLAVTGLDDFGGAIGAALLALDEVG